VTGRLTLEEVIGIIQPLRGGGSVPFRIPIGTVTTDSREVTGGSLFIALPGSRTDGTEFVGEAFAKGALAAIVPEERAVKVPPVLLAEHPVFVVRNPVEALGDLARAHRMRMRGIPLVGITGSSGKTSTKELLVTLLSRGRRVLRNPGNRNNLIGMPLALLALSDEDEVAVLELGTNSPGEIGKLASIALPDIGIVTNIGPAHLEGLGNLEGVSREKGDLFRALGESGTAIVNATDLRVVREAGRCRAAKVFYGVALSEFSGRILSMDDTGMRIVVRTPSGEFSSDLPMAGEHNLMNAMAAAAAAYTLGMRPREMENGFASASPGRGRFQAIPLRGGGLLLDDSYNANPASMEAAIRNLEALRKGRRVVAVLGTMLELGAASPASHFRIGHLLAGAEVDRLITHGEDADTIARGAVQGGMDASRVTYVPDRERLLDTVFAALREGDLVLVKASRGIRLDEISDAIEREWA